MAERTGRIVAIDEYEPNDEFEAEIRASLSNGSCPKCGADLDDGECEECERSAPLDFDQ